MIVSFDKSYQPWRAASNDDTRPLLTGVQVDPRGLLVATDTHMLAVIPCEIEGECPPEGVIIPASLLKNAAAAVTKRDGALVKVKVDPEKHEASALTKAGWATASLIEGKFPAWGRCVEPALDQVKAWEKRKPAVCQVGLNPALMASLAAAIGIEDGRFLHHWTGDLQPVTVFTDTPAFGILMPMQADFSKATFQQKAAVALAWIVPPAPVKEKKVRPSRAKSKAPVPVAVSA
jgi:hypothetical protein